MHGLSKLCLLVTAALLVPSAAHAFKLKTTPDGAHTVRWGQEQVSLRIDPAAEAVLGAEALRAAAEMASDAWRGLPGAPDILIEDGEPDAYDPERRGNGIYLVAPWPFEATQVAMTVTTFAQNGRVLGTDVLLNGEKRFALLSEAPGALTTEHVYDLGAVLTHELGHVLGLDHSEHDPEATMWAQVHAGEVHQRSVEIDDEEGLVAVYAVPLQKPEAAGASCSVALAEGQAHGRAQRSAGMLFGLALLALALRRRAV